VGWASTGKLPRLGLRGRKGMANFKRQKAKGKCETTNHLPFDLCYLPFAFVWVWESKGSAEFPAPLPFKEFVAGRRRS
jgi:hypothetical protein